ncbi:hypothetical protein AB4Y45_33030 [Paraburkholderia sp. EG287A]|uniref:hypothetical protein n=1 Tax=Paraburkholderia sp. EG287A TaxID=3237012 RepID=UPI0034D21EB2
MTTTTTGHAFKRFFVDAKYWPEGESTFYDDVLLHVDGRALSDCEDPRDVADNAIVEIRSGWVMDIPSAAAGGANEMSLEDYFLHWKKQQTTASLVVECPRELLERVIQAVKDAGGTVQQSGEQQADQAREA